MRHLVLLAVLPALVLAAASQKGGRYEQVATVPGTVHRPQTLPGYVGRTDDLSGPVQTAQRPGQHRPQTLPAQVQQRPGQYGPQTLPAQIPQRPGQHRPQTLPAQVNRNDVEPGPVHGSGSSRPQFNPSELSRPYNPPSGQQRESTGPVGHASGSSRPGQTFIPGQLSKPYNGDQQRDVKRG